MVLLLALPLGRSRREDFDYGDPPGDLAVEPGLSDSVSGAAGGGVVSPSLFHVLRLREEEGRGGELSSGRRRFRLGMS